MASYKQQARTLNRQEMIVITCIAAVIDDGAVYIGGDSFCGVSGYPTAEQQAVPKVYRLEEFVIGGAGGIRQLQLAQYSFMPPCPRSYEPEYLLRYMCVEFVDVLKQTLHANDATTIADACEYGYFDLIVGIRNRLFVVGGDFSVVAPLQPYTAVGCGRDVAIGALAAMPGVPPVARITRALELAAQSCPFVMGPYTVISNRLGADALEAEKEHACVSKTGA